MHPSNRVIDRAASPVGEKAVDTIVTRHLYHHYGGHSVQNLRIPGEVIAVIVEHLIVADCKEPIVYRGTAPIFHPMQRFAGW